jgi:DNA mismatch repair protein MutS
MPMTIDDTGLASACPDDADPDDADPDGAGSGLAPDPGPPQPAGAFASLLFPDPPGSSAGAEAADGFLSDVRLDQVFGSVAGDREERDLIAAQLTRPARDAAIVNFRHEVFRDLAEPAVLGALTRFSERLTKVRAHLRQTADMASPQQREGWFLDAAIIYCEAIGSLATDLDQAPVSSSGLAAFRSYLRAYAGAPGFAALARDTRWCKDRLSAVQYLVRIKGPRIEVSRYSGEPDYSAEITKTFERFQQGAVKDYLISYRSTPGMNHVGAQILQFVARLFSDEFTVLRDFCRRHADFLDPVIRQFDRELQFYLSYLAYIGPLRRAGLSFCLPEVSASSKDVFASDTFDLALAAKLTAAGKTVVTNDFHLTGRERVIVVSGPNQGGKTTFARTFGQLHHLAAIGCPVPGRSARLFLPDRILTHFEQREDLASLTGKLEDDLIRIRRALLTATPDTVVIMNEVFASTALADARLLGEKVLRKVIELDLLCVYVTFIDELASCGPSVVSMAAAIEPDDPARRTYKVVRKPADGLAYALAIAAKNQVTYEQLKKRLAQ